MLRRSCRPDHDPMAAGSPFLQSTCSAAPLALGEHAVDEPDVDDFGVQGAPAGIVDGVCAVAAHQPEEPVDLAHLRPRQRMLQRGGRVGADMLPMDGCFALQRIQIPLA